MGCLSVFVYSGVWRYLQENTEGSPLSLTINIVFSPSRLSAENSCKIRHYESLLESILGGAVCAILVFIFVPFFAEGMSPSIAIAKMTNSPLKIISLIETIGISGMIFGCMFSLFAWIGRRKREREETDELMREYLKKKLQEENDKQL